MGSSAAPSRRLGLGPRRRTPLPLNPPQTLQVGVLCADAFQTCTRPFFYSSVAFRRNLLGVVTLTPAGSLSGPCSTSLIFAHTRSPLLVTLYARALVCVGGRREGREDSLVRICVFIAGSTLGNTQVSSADLVCWPEFARPMLMVFCQC
jgi:hypothetical protein